MTEHEAPQSLEQGWAAMAELYRQAWDQVFRLGPPPEDAAHLLGEALARMRALAEAAEAQVFGPAAAPRTAASRAEYSEIGARIERVAARMAALESALTAPPPVPPKPPKKRKSAKKRK